MLARLSALVIWGLVAASAVFWGLRLVVRAPTAPANTVAVADAGGERGDLTRLWGAAPVEAPVAELAPEMAARFQLVGVMAPRASAATSARRPQGVALIAVDGNPPKAFAVGSALDTDLVLQSVSLRTASIGPARGDTALKLELPALPPPTTGTLPVAGAPPARGGGAIRVPGRPTRPPANGFDGLPQPPMQPAPDGGGQDTVEPRELGNGMPTE